MRFPPQCDEKSLIEQVCASLRRKVPRAWGGGEGPCGWRGKLAKGRDGGPGAWPGQGAKGEEGTRNETHSVCSRLLVFVCLSEKAGPKEPRMAGFCLRGKRKKHSLCSRLLVFVLPLRKSSAQGASDEKAEAPSAELFLRGRTKQANGCRVSAFHSCNLFLERISGPPSDAEA